MSFTDGRWEGGTSFPDKQFFVGAESFIDTSAHAVVSSSGAGLFSLNLASTLAGTFFANPGLLLRTGVLASSYDQEQFGTAAGVAGPSSVANTSGPLGLPPGFPPISQANMATIAGSLNGTGTGIQRGPIPKGTQIDSIDVIYTAATVAASVATLGLTKTVFTNGNAPAVTNLIALGANGLVTAAAANPKVVNVLVPTPSMITDMDAEPIINVNLTAGAGGTITFYGVVLHCHYNFN
jgi:hypothetical protein